jgi:transmembrane sensor
VQPTYEHFTIADFLTDDSFVNHQLAPTTESRSFWDNWLKAFPHRRQEWQQAVNLLEAIRLGLDNYAHTYLSDEIIRQLLARIERTNTQLNQSPAPVRPLAWRRWAAAASVILLAGVGLWLWTNRASSPYEQHLTTLPNSFREIINETDKPQTVRLPDHSVVVLASNSRLSYPLDFGKQNRKVYLAGEATFDVTRNPHKPFLVHASELVTKVLGTRFLVRAFAREAEVRVQVHSGQVSVYHSQTTTPQVKQKGVLLLPNQQVVFSRHTEQFEKTLIELPQLIRPITPRKQLPSFSYNETPVAQVFHDLTEAYGIEIRYNKEVFAPCQLTSSLSQETFEKKLDIICRSIGAAYEIIDGQVVITGGNCQ